MSETTATTLYGVLAETAAREPAGTMFIEPAAGGYRTVSRAEFLGRVDSIAALLRDRGVGSGQCVATWLPNWSEAYAWQFAASAVGAHVIGINTRYNVSEVAHVLHKARPAVLAMAHDFQRLDLPDRARSALSQDPGITVPAVVPVPGPGQPDPQDPSAYDLGAGVWTVPASDGEATTRPGAGVVPEPPAADRLSVAFTTSGSTGMPKLAAHSEAGVIAHARADAVRMGITGSDVLIGALPFSGVFGFSASMAAIFSGAAILLHPVFDEQELVRAMAEFGGSHFVGADDMLSRIAAAWAKDRPDLSALKWIGIADFQGQSRTLAAWAAREFGTTTVGVYGSSELFALTAFWAPDTDEDRRWGGGGYPVSPDIKVRIADPFSGEVLPPSGEGELQFHGPNVVNAYLGDSGEGAAAFTADGWFSSGDLGTICEDGGFVYLCRIGDVLRLKGFLVHPSEIEYRLAQHPAVDTAKVVGLKAPNGEDQAIGFVTVRPEAAAVTGTELQNWCRESLARFKVPSTVHVVAEMPTTAGTNGTKIRAATLRQWAKERSSLGPDSAETPTSSTPASAGTGAADPRELENVK
jgi:acyl-CoA synthetase (AMP-forming)/AMP-acid ligase II